MTSYASSLGNVEGTEWKLPLLYLYRRRLMDSAGAGCYRGGATSEVAITPYGANELTLKLTNTAGTEQTNAHGLNGGYPGAGSQSVIVRIPTSKRALRVKPGLPGLRISKERLPGFLPRRMRSSEKETYTVSGQRAGADSATRACARRRKWLRMSGMVSSQSRKRHGSTV